MIRLYNTLTKKTEEFVPRNPKLVTLYSCGPTVYDYAHIGNFRTYTMTDILVRTLKYLGYQVKYVSNITDVGHLVSDADSGEDKLEKGAKREGKTAWDVAKFYTDAFLADSKKLNLLAPDVRPKPTEHIPEQISMVQTLLDKGFAYTIDDGIYFDTSKFSKYGQLTEQNIGELKAGARVEVNPQKRNPTDFALWKFTLNPPAGGQKRDMEWDSPFGKGFPGWHIECSAMSRKYLGDQIDIHTGGADLVPIHHTNEIAQSESATGRSPFVAYWVHGQFILVDNEKMAKSKGNFFRLSDIEAKGIDPLALRYLYLTAHYRAFLNFTWEGLANAAKSLEELRLHVSHLNPPTGGQNSKRNALSEEKLEKVDAYRKKFDEALANDLNMPQALAVVWEVVKSSIPSRDKYDLLMDFDEVLGFNFTSVDRDKQYAYTAPQTGVAIRSDVTLGNATISRIDARELARRGNDFATADKLREEIAHIDQVVLEDSASGTVVKKQ